MAYRILKKTRLIAWGAATVALIVPAAMIPNVAVAEPDPNAQTITTVLNALADTTLQAWAGEKIQSMNAKPYVAALQPNGHGYFGEQFDSTNTGDGTDAKTGMVTFNLSAFDEAPQNAILRLSYLGWAGGHVPSATDTNTIKVIAVDDTSCTNNASSCPTGQATWATRPRFSGEDGRAIAESQPFAFGSTRYADSMVVHSSTPVDLDVTAIIAEEFAKGPDHKVVTFVIGESKHYDIRFASTEGAGSLSGANQDMGPKLTVTTKAKGEYLSVTAPTKTRYQAGESFDPTGLTVRLVNTADGSETVLTENQYTLSGTDYDTNQVGGHPITVTSNDDHALSATFLIYTVVANDTEDALDTSRDNFLWYLKPASQTKLRLPAGSIGQGDNNQWQQTTLPVGNGKIGGTVWGEIGTERITFNEETLWTGGPGTTSNYNGGNNRNKGRDGLTLRSLNRQLAAGADTVNPHGLTGGEDARQQGSYQNWGNIFIDYGFGNNTTFSEYRRDLNLDKGIASVSFKHDGKKYTREYFASNPDNVMVSRLKAEDGAELNLKISLNPNPGFSKTDASTKVNGDILTVKGALGNNGLIYNSKIKAIVDQGTVGASKDGESLTVSGASVVTLYIAAATDYKQVYPNYRTGEDAEQVDLRVAKNIQDAANKGYGAVRDAHVADHEALYHRVSLDLGQSKLAANEELNTEKLLDVYNAGTATPAQKRELETKVYQYGRYLTIGSSRENSQLPANLQGIWSSTADDNAHGRTPWGSDFHMNVNLQMNYWPTYSANLAELAKPLISYATGLVEPGRVTAKIYAGANTAPGTPVGEGQGYMVHTENTAYGWTTPGAAFSWGWSPAAMPWLLQNVYEAYEYSGDKGQLESEIYPLLKEESNFYVDYMLHKGFLPASDGTPRLTTGVAYSAEHGPQGTDGNAYESSLVWQMLNDAIESAQALGVDDSLVGNLENCSVDNWAKDDSGRFIDGSANRSWSCAQNLLKPIEVGASGQIKEWYFEGELGKKLDGSPIPSYQVNHRHMSHMLGLFPGDLITVDNPTYMDAAKTSMTYRGDDATGWGVGQRINAWARTGDGNHAYQLIEKQLKNAMYANLFDVHPPFQIDGNFGNTSGVNEMLMQSNSTFVGTDGKKYQNYTNILPALPDQWADGKIRGLVARGAFTVGIDWEAGEAERILLHSGKGNQAAIKITEGGSKEYQVTMLPVVAGSGSSFRNALAPEAVPHKTVTNSAGETLLVFNTTAGANYLVAEKPPVVPVTAIAVSGKPAMNEGETQALTVEVSPETATDKTVTWVSSDSEVAAVDASGMVTAVKAGTVTISATSLSAPNVVGSFEIEVSAVASPESPEPGVSPETVESPEPGVSPETVESPEPGVSPETVESPEPGVSPETVESPEPNPTQENPDSSVTNETPETPEPDASTEDAAAESVAVSTPDGKAKVPTAAALSATGVNGMLVSVISWSLLLLGVILLANRKRSV
ncbi:glycosyl hydrolase family 95 catalytic domain-containing protein [Boudabousia marimammalium]|uniref:BIG2 domain-containing protein n=1 Tax=Boudabousia marimammalium TaxID=156892 RepID=A0A1Q5PR16_9ACTO|nr:glycoside hydrolase N-terminal domain-containing protein [Boudabousia marimammalium]OKL49912.1 hypothetical protein BM477_03120 [Boudabousia marimammalium]